MKWQKLEQMLERHWGTIPRLVLVLAMASSQVAKTVLSVAVLEHVERRRELVLPVPPLIAGWLAVNSLAGGVVLSGIWPAAITMVMCKSKARMKKN